ncbi:MAG TPA: site-2 protease family protein [Thermoanaerobaculia bacterium]|nr:site-2 protease family protein [Thermoanaerobaculia bacterium]
MSPERLFTGGVEILVLLLAISAHESAHAWTADRCGDSTARSLGRVSLNPLRHLDIFGSLLLPLLQVSFQAPVFGWGRPAPVQPQSFRDPRRGELLVAAAGPFANVLLAAVAVFGLLIAVHVLGPDARRAAYYTLMQQTGSAADLPGFPVVFTLVRMATINAFLVVFNLIPLPPLDGGQIALYMLPPDWAAKLAGVRPYGFIIGIALAAFGVVTLLLIPFYGVLSVVIHLL